jgi:hypothetical protein
LDETEYEAVFCGQKHSNMGLYSNYRMFISILSSPRKMYLHFQYIHFFFLAYDRLQLSCSTAVVCTAVVCTAIVCTGKTKVRHWTLKHTEVNVNVNDYV